MRTTYPHGDVRRYWGMDACRCDACRSAKWRYEKRRKWLAAQGRALLVDSTGFVRRVRALCAIGWTQLEIARSLGIATGNLKRKMRSPYVRRATHLAMAEFYERHCMDARDDTRARALAARYSWQPPLAWDDIDAGVLADQVGDTSREALIDRALNEDDFTPTFGVAEKKEIVRRWLEAGRTIKDLSRISGWTRIERYREKVPS